MPAASALAAASRSGGASASSGLRVESVTVVAVHRPEDGGLLLRVLPNLAPRREASTGTGTGAREREPSTSGAEEGGEGTSAGGEDGDVPPEPASAALVSRLQATPLSGDLVAGGVCVICADDFFQVGTPIVLLSCGHAFHDPCIREWLTRRHTCPTCRLELEVDDVRYLRSIGLCEEADALEQVERARQARELELQAASRRRWLDSMRRGEPVHFGLACGRCELTPLVGECYRCETCEGYILCGDCYALREAAEADFDGHSPITAAVLAEAPPAAVLDGGASGEEREAMPVQPCGCCSKRAFDDHPDDHIFLPFSSGGPSLGGMSSGHSGLLTVLVPARSHSDESDYDEDGFGDEARAEAAMAAAEVAFAAVRSLALAPLARERSSFNHTASGLGTSSLRRSRQSRHQATRSLRR